MLPEIPSVSEGNRMKTFFWPSDIDTDDNTRRMRNGNG